MNAAKPSNNGKKSGVWGRLFGKNHTEPAVETLSPEETTSEIDKKIEKLQQTASEVHQAILVDVGNLQKRIRCSELRMKRLNGGLTMDETRELEHAQES